MASAGASMVNARVDGFNLHASVVVVAGDREGRERLCRYVLRPSVCASRLSRLDDGRIAYRVKHPRSANATHRVMTPMELMSRRARRGGGDDGAKPLVYRSANGAAASSARPAAASGAGDLPGGEEVKGCASAVRALGHRVAPGGRGFLRCIAALWKL